MKERVTYTTTKPIAFVLTKSSSKDSAALSAKTQCFKSRPVKKAVNNQHCWWTSLRLCLILSINLQCTCTVALRLPVLHFVWPLPMTNKYSNKHDYLKNPNWHEADQLAIYKINVAEKLNLGQPRTTSASGKN